MKYQMRSRIRNRCVLLALLCAISVCFPDWQVRAGAGDQPPQQERVPLEMPAVAKDGRIKDYSPYPQPDAGYVTDLANLLTPDEEERIERWLWQAESRTGVEVIVVTIESVEKYVGGPKSMADYFARQLNEKHGALHPVSSPVSIEQFARGLFDAYGIGNMPANDGVLLLVAVQDRAARIELGAGYGHIRDADARRIMDEEILPSFRKEDYATGIRKGVTAILLEYADVRVGVDWLLLSVAIAIPVVALISYSLFRSGKRGWGWVCFGLLIVLILVLLQILIRTLRHAPRGGSGGWSPGGLGGFGGGFSGGGGATGRW